MTKTMENDVDIKIEITRTCYKVSGNISKKIPWNRIKGYFRRLDNNGAYHCIPVEKRKDLWAILKIYETGKKVIGPKGIFTIE